MRHRLTCAAFLLLLSMLPVFALAAPLRPAAPAAPVASAPAGPRTPPLVRVFEQPGGWERAFDRLRDRAIDFLPSLGAALVVLVVVFLVYRLTASILHSLLRRTHADPAVQDIVIRLARFVIVAFGVVMAAGQMGFQVGSVLAGLGIVGLTVGFAAQDSLANLVAGITILWDRPFHIGDNVTIGGTYGQVKAIGLRTTRITTVEKIDVILPNKTVINEKIFNHTQNPHLRLGVAVGIGYDQDIEAARAALLAAVAGHPLLADDPPAKVVVKNLGASTVDLELRVWLRDPHREREVLVEMMELVKVTLDRAGVDMPFPQQTLHLANLAEFLQATAGAGRPSVPETPDTGETPSRES